MEGEGNSTDEHKPVTPPHYIRGLITMLLSRLDAAIAGIEALGAAFRAEDACRALAIIESLQKTWTEAYLAITLLEQLSGCHESNAWQAFALTRQRASAPLELAWSIISRMPNEHYDFISKNRICRASKP